MTQVKKIKTAQFHNANGLSGQKPKASYGIFKDGKQVGVVLTGSGLWEAWDMDCKRRLTFGCTSLKQLKNLIIREF